jgi:hypothetical protein
MLIVVVIFNTAVTRLERHSFGAACLLTQRQGTLENARFGFGGRLQGWGVGRGRRGAAAVKTKKVETMLSLLFLVIFEYRNRNDHLILSESNSVMGTLCF